jgi:peptidyl-prolyl cis-trans isomerase C
MLHPRSLAIGAVFGAGLTALAILPIGCKKAKSDAPGEHEAPAPGAPPQSDAELDAPVATIDDVVITVRDFQDRINRQSPFVRARYNSIEHKKEFLDSLVRYEVLAREALRRGLDKDPDAVRALKTVMIQKLMKAEFETSIRPEDIPDSELQAYYDAHPEEWNKPEEVRVSAIVVKDKKLANTVAKAALGDEGKSNKGFHDLVVKYTTDKASKDSGGDLRYFSRDTKDLPAPVVDAAFSLAKTGDTIGPIDAGDGRYFLLKQTGRRRAIAKTFDQVKRQIQNTVWKDKRVQAQQQFVDGLRKKSKIEVFDEALKKVRIDTSSSQLGDPHGHGQGLPGFPGEAPPEPPVAPANGQEAAHE